MEHPHKKIIGGGLKVKKFKDPRRFIWKKREVFGATLQEPPDDYDLITPLKIKDQSSSDFCFAFATTSSLEPKLGIVLSPEYEANRTRLLMGVPISSFGGDPDTACKATIKFGLLGDNQSPIHLDQVGRDAVVDKNAFSATQDAQASVNKQIAYYDIFDSFTPKFEDLLRTGWAIKQRLADKAPGIMVGTYWQSEWTYEPLGIVKSVGTDKSLPHEFLFIGAKKINGIKYAKFQLSSGDSLGDKGIYYFPKEVVDKMFLFAKVIDEGNPEELKKELWGLLAKLYDTLTRLMSFLNLKK